MENCDGYYFNTFTEEELDKFISHSESEILIAKLIKERDTESKHVLDYFQELMDSEHEIEILENKLKETRQQLESLTEENKNLKETINSTREDLILIIKLLTNEK